MKAALRTFQDLVLKKAPEARLSVDAPADSDGIWFVDIQLRKKRVALEFRPKAGFALYRSKSEFGEGPTEIYRTAELAARRVIRIVTGSEVNGEFTLKDLRDLYELTQEDLAKKIGVKQAAVSRFEKRREVKLGTLSDAIKAIGGRLEVRAVFKDSDIRLSMKG
jgi:DNA-binding XRE family transcriptional regulator